MGLSGNNSQNIVIDKLSIVMDNIGIIFPKGVINWQLKHLYPTELLPVFQILDSNVGYVNIPIDYFENLSYEKFIIETFKLLPSQGVIVNSHPIEVLSKLSGRKNRLRNVERYYNSFYIHLNSNAPYTTIFINVINNNVCVPINYLRDLSWYIET